jgi:hypothetical protein
MNKWNVEINKILDSDIDFTKLSHKELETLHDIFITPGQLAMRIGRYKGPKILRNFL